MKSNQPREIRDAAMLESAEWARLVSRLDEPHAAGLLAQFFTDHPTLQLRYPGVYLHAVETSERAFCASESSARRRATFMAGARFIGVLLVGVGRALVTFFKRPRRNEVSEPDQDLMHEAFPPRGVQPT